MPTDRCLEVLGEGGSGHQGHSLAGKNSYPSSRGTGEVLFENILPGGAALHQSCAPRPCERKMSGRSWRALSSGQGFRHGRVSRENFYWPFLFEILAGR